MSGAFNWGIWPRSPLAPPDCATQTVKHLGLIQELIAMPRYLVERDFPDGLSIPQDQVGAKICQTVVDNNAEDLVTWIHSYVTPDRRRTFCIYDAPAPEAIRRAANRNKLPISQITEVRVLDPYFYSVKA
jgi:hypothetical protein